MRYPYTPPTFGGLPPLGSSPPSMAPPPILPQDIEHPPWWQRLFGGDTGLALGQLAPAIAGAPNLHTALAQLGQIPAIRQALQFQRTDREREERERKLQEELKRNEEARRQEEERRAKEIHKLNLELGGKRAQEYAAESKIRQAEEALRARDPDRMTPAERLEAERLAAAVKEMKARRRAIDADALFSRKRAELLSQPKEDVVGARQSAAAARRSVEQWQREEIKTEREIVKVYGADQKDWPPDAVALLDKVKGLREQAEQRVAVLPAAGVGSPPPGLGGPAPTGPAPTGSPRSGLAGAVDARTEAVSLLRAKAQETVGRDLKEDELVRIMGKLESLSPERRQEFLERLKMTRNLAPLLTEFGF